MMIRNLFQAQLLAFLLLFSTVLFAQNYQVNGTTGTPLGGFGAGAIKFNASNGTFAVMTQAPADAYDFIPAGKSRFSIETKPAGEESKAETLKALSKNNGPDDDAIWPLHLVNFGTANQVKINMTAFSPFDNITYTNMSLPYAFFEFSLKNTSNTAVETILALEWDGGKEAFSSEVPGGIANQNWAILAKADQKARQLNTHGSALGNVATKLKIEAGKSAVVRFVIAWYDHTDPEIAYYKNQFSNPAEIAQHGMLNFERLKKNATSMVAKMRASNLPSWLINQTQNTLANLSTNSMYKKDGRVAFAEGQWTCFGTMDQMWHARQIIGQLTPFYAWQELRYWARTQMKNGQIHHDFNQMDVGPDREKRSVLVAWDDTEHADYRNVQKWVDLNCAMIVSTYEMYQITGDKKEFDFLWPYLKKAAQRILDQVELYGNKAYPYTFDHSENSYDAGGDPNVFNASFSAVAYRVMVILAKEKNEQDLVDKYALAYQTVVKSFAARYLNDDPFKLSKHMESYFGGQWLALHLKLGEIWSAAQTDDVLKKLNTYYQPYYFGMNNNQGTYDEWTPYLLSHYGGLLLNTNRQNQWEVMQKDAYERQYLNRNLVFDHPLNILPQLSAAKLPATSIKSGNQYISLPAIWRNYYDLIGYHRDRRTNELWLTPVLPPSLNHELKNACYLSPEGGGTISCKESGIYNQNKKITFKPSRPLTVTNLYLADNFGKALKVSINGKNYPFKRLGQGYAKLLAVQYDAIVKEEGLHIVVDGDAGHPNPPVPEKENVRADGEITKVTSAFRLINAASADKKAGVEMAREKDGTSYLTSCNNFDYIQFSALDFGKGGESVFYAQIAQVAKASTIEVLLDDVAGEVIGSHNIATVLPHNEWDTISIKLAPVSGVHDVIIRFSGTTAANLFNLKQVAFGHAEKSYRNPFH